MGLRADIIGSGQKRCFLTLSDHFLPNLAVKQQARRADVSCRRTRTNSHMPSGATILSVVVVGRPL